ncbi:MAG: T9SS type A sorting domain-containing protein, partial [Chitinophagaceae bacterium]|nr:T9SS type A sorting domain-containing protein [Chitinophagaceae bacterium]
DAGTTNLSSTIYVFDPNLSSSGAYATYNATTHTTAPVASAANKYIQPGQAIFVKNTSVAPTLTFRETHKAPNSANLTNVFKASSDSASFSKIYINLNKQLNNLSYKIADGVAIVFDNSFNDGDGPEDASKISNNLENLSIIAKNAKQWIIEGRKQAYINDTVQLRMYYGANAPVGGNYQLEINMDEFINNGLQAYLYDNYTNTLTSLGMTGISTYNYNVTSTAATYNYRFSIVFKSGSVLPVSFITLNAAIQNKDVSVNWTVAESNIASYQIQRSSNAVEFTTVGTVVANGNAISSTQKYNWIDAEPLNGNNYYRIIANGKDGKTTNSSIVLVRLSDNSSITVYPNPVKDRRMNLLTESLAKGDYEIQVYNLEGKNIYSSIIKHNGGTASYVINLPLAVTSGMYQMIIKGKEYTNTQNIVVE